MKLLFRRQFFGCAMVILLSSLSLLFSLSNGMHKQFQHDCRWNFGRENFGPQTKIFGIPLKIGPYTLELTYFLLKIFPSCMHT